MLEQIKDEIERLKKVQKEKLEYLQQLRNTTAQTEADIHQISGALAICEKLMVDAATGKNGKVE